jgi:hypothetical protein
MIVEKKKMIFKFCGYIYIYIYVYMYIHPGIPQCGQLSSDKFIRGPHTGCSVTLLLVQLNISNIFMIKNLLEILMLTSLNFQNVLFQMSRH